MRAITRFEVEEYSSSLDYIKDDLAVIDPQSECSNTDDEVERIILFTIYRSTRVFVCGKRKGDLTIKSCRLREKKSIRV